MAECILSVACYMQTHCGAEIRIRLYQRFVLHYFRPLLICVIHLCFMAST